MLYKARKFLSGMQDKFIAQFIPDIHRILKQQADHFVSNVLSDAMTTAVCEYD